MLFILHVVMKTLDKTCCHVYIWLKCLYDNITTLGLIMDIEQESLLQAELLNSSFNKTVKPLDFSVLDDLKKKSKKSNRFVTCSICGKTITKNSMVRHFFAFHSGDDHA